MMFAGIIFSWTFFIVSGTSSGHLRLEPPGQFHAFFTGDNFFITCIPDPGSGATRLAWQTPSCRDITHTKGRVHVEPSTNNILGLELVVEEVRYKDQGTFTCTAIVDGRETRISFNLTVYLSITFWDTPEVQIGKEGNDFMIMCSVRADPSPIVSWYVNESLIFDSPRLIITEDGIFIKNLKTTDAGNYTCKAFVVTPFKSQIREKQIAVHVHYKPRWRNNGVDSFYTVVGSVGNLSCEAESQPPPTFEWFKGRVLLGNNKIYRISNGPTKSLLQVKVKSQSNLGTYLCLVSNAVGEIQKEINLLEGTSPNIPSFTLSSDEPGILAVRIHSSPLDTLPVKGYKIQWKLAEDSWRSAKEYLSSTGNDIMIHDLHFDTEYVARVAARNDVGFSNYTDTKVQRTKGLIAEAVFDGGSIMSSTFNQSPASLSPSHPSMLIFVMFMISRFFHQQSRCVKT